MSTNNVEGTKFNFSITDVLNEVNKLSEKEKDILLGNSKVTDIQYVLNNPETLTKWCCETEIGIKNAVILVNAFQKMITSLGEQEVAKRMDETEEMLEDWLTKLKEEK